MLNKNKPAEEKELKELFSCSQLLQRLIQSVVWLLLVMKFCDFWHLCFELCSLTLEGASPQHWELCQPAACPAPAAGGSLCPCALSVLHALHPSATTESTTWAKPEHSTVHGKEVPEVWWGHLYNCKALCPHLPATSLLSFPCSS